MPETPSSIGQWIWSRMQGEQPFAVANVQYSPPLHNDGLNWRPLLWFAEVSGVCPEVSVAAGTQGHM
jgi:hypothetical protein